MSKTYCYIKTPLGELLAVQGGQGLENLSFQSCHNYIISNSNWIKDKSLFKELEKQLTAYFNKELKNFSIKLNPLGTHFQQKVWNALQEIPFGTTVSYKYIAEVIGNPKGCRAAGSAAGKNPIPIIIPCHRVIGSDGSLAGFTGGLDIKRYLLNLENKNL